MAPVHLAIDKKTRYLSQGRFQEAEVELARELQTCESHQFNIGDVNCFDTVKELSQIYILRGKYENAAKLCGTYKGKYIKIKQDYLRALEKKSTQEIQFYKDQLLVRELSINNCLMQSFQMLNDLDQAKKFADQTYKTIDRFSLRYSKTVAIAYYSDLISVYTETGDKDKVARIISTLETITQMKIEKGPDRSMKSVKFNDHFFAQERLAAGQVLAAYYFRLGEYRLAELITEYCIQTQKNRYIAVLPLAVLLVGYIPGLEQSFLFYEQKMFLSKCLIKQGKYNESLVALTNLEQELSKVNPEVSQAHSTWELHKNIADAYSGLGRTSEALTYYKNAIDKVENIRSYVENSRSRMLFTEEKNDLYSSVIRLLVSRKDYQGAFIYSERARARTFLDMMGYRIAGSNNSELIGKRNRLLAETNELNIQAALDTKGARSAMRAVEIKEKELQNINRDIFNKYPELATAISIVPISLSDLQQELDANIKILEYYVTNDETFIWIIGRTSFECVSLPYGNKIIGPLVQSFREEIGNPKSEKLLPLLEQLDSKLFSPARPYLKVGDRLCIVPHGVLHSIPFQALFDGNQYVVQQYSIFYIPSSNILHFVKEKRTKKGFRLLAFGNPELNNPSLALPFSEQEVKDIGKMLPGSSIYIGKDATKENLLNNINSYNITHIASHAVYNRSDPMLSGIYLAAGSRPSIFTSEEIFNIRINSYLVTLSACETAVGRATRGDEVISLSRAFLFAGTPSVISSLWSVNDESTAYLMSRFYLNLKTMDKATALQKAQIETMSTYPSSHYWGAFTLIGDWM